MAHGAPVHRGDPAAIGIKDIDAPEFGRAVTRQPDQVPVFWACGVTPQEALAAASPPLAITHAPGQMFVADITSERWPAASPQSTRRSKRWMRLAVVG